MGQHGMAGMSLSCMCGIADVRAPPLPSPTQPQPHMQPTIKDVIGAEKEKEFMESLETMGEPMHRARSLCGGPWFATEVA